MLRRRILGAVAAYAMLAPMLAFGQTAQPQKIYNAPADVIAKIRDEGTNRSEVMKTLSYLSDVIGPRLTASPGMKRANNWTRDTLAGYGLQNAHLESWGPFGRGWSLKKFYAMVDGPTAFPLIAYPKAWSPGTDTLFAKPGAQGTAYTADVVYFNASSEAELAQYRGKLKGKIVLVGPMRELKAHFEPQGTRSTDSELLELADAPDPATVQRTPRAGRRNNPAFLARFRFNSERMRFLADEGAAVLIDAGRGDGGTIFVQQATAIQPPAAPEGQPQPQRVSLYDKNAKIPIQISAAAEHFNRMVRMINAGEKVTMTVDLNVAYQDEDLNGYNTIAEIPGTDLADQVVMLGGHLDSWQAGTGATDNGAGCAVMMEAVRILQKLGLKPRRTIRIALWTGEEQGLFGSRAYVKQHFGYRGDGTSSFGGGRNAADQKLTKLPEYDKLSAYFNIDNGTGKVRGVYMQGNDNVRPIFREWLDPFKDMGATTLTMSNTGGTDHLSFDAIGLPGFQFIQDEVEYSSRTHHSNMDVFDRIQADDMKQMSIILASFVYQTAMMDQKMPKKDGVE